LSRTLAAAAASSPEPSCGRHMSKQPVLTRHESNREGVDLPPDTLDKLDKLDLKASKNTLYQFDQSPPCWKVRALLHYYGVPYESVTAYPGSKVEGLDNTYQKIPKLMVDDVQINDSAVVYRTLGPLLSGTPLTAAQVELEKRNNIKGLLGALEKETASSYFGIAEATRALTADWGKTSYVAALIKPVLPYAAGLIFPLPMLALSRAPHGKDGPSLAHGKVYQEALGKGPFFHGEQLGLLDLSLYGTFACFLSLRSPPAAAVLDQCGLRAWYERVDASVKAVRPLDA